MTKILPVIYALCGAIILCLLATIQKLSIGAPLVLKGYLVPFLFGSISVFFLGRRDVALQKKQRQLILEKEQLAVTIRSIGDGVITTNLDGDIVLINKIAEELTGWSQQDAIGKSLQDVFNIINERTGQPCENPINQVLETGLSRKLANHTALISRDGTLYTIEDTGSPIFDNDNKIIGAVLVFRDTTSQRKIEEELFKVKKLESVGILAGGIAHDFNNILAAILGNIEFAETFVEPSSKAVPLLKQAMKASIRAKGLTKQLLTFSKGGNPVKESSSIDKIIKDSADFILHGSSVICRYDFPGDLWVVKVDTGQFSQVIQNFIINARDAMAEGGSIEVSCENINNTDKENLQIKTEKCIKITISDSGTGIPEKYIDKIFDPYFTTKQDDSSGLGLAICHSIIRKHDGHISVCSQENKGTIFSIYLPVETEKSQNFLQETKFSKTKNKALIMVMDDEAMVRNLLQQMLINSGHEVIPVENGNEAIEIYNEYFVSNRIIDIIIMDLTIAGGMGGRQTVKEILKINPEAKIIVASGYSNDPVMANFKKYGFQASIDKPFRFAELNETINKVLG
jgi:two-component system, cell cycle sensor histidine kinase and response regulator CckA